MLQIRGRSYVNGEPIVVVTDGERIARVDPAWPHSEAQTWPWIAPGLFDLQINGHKGVWFCDPKLRAEQVLQILHAHFAFGITRLCPTLITASFEALCAGLSAIRQACESSHWAERLVPGIHLEGPYISAEEGPRGAHPKSQVRPANWDEFQKLQEASGNRIRLVTLAPETGNALNFIRRAVESGVVVSIGHTAATPEQVTAAVDAGATLSTHLGNGAHGMIRRHPNYIWEQLGDSRLTACLITDGHHLPASVIRSIVRTKSTLHTIITCDAAGLAGCPPGRYEIESGTVEILPEGKIVVADSPQYLAGSAQLTHECVAQAISAANLSLRDSWDMASRNVARALKVEEHRLARGSRADLAVFDWQGPGSDIRIRATIAAGELQFGQIPALD
jgi:N-acetylglucosamine-6-phosphate deacetylase